MTTPLRDRALALQASTTLNGMDFVELDAGDATVLRVHFLNAVPVAAPGVTAAIDGGDRIPTVPLAPIAAADWSTDVDGRPLLTLHVLGEADFSAYRLTLTAPALDRMFASTRFSFMALCPSDFDCTPAPPWCPPDDTDLPPIDYLAKDFRSFRQALLEFSSLRYPAWQERSEADFGVMFAEALSAVADELSYQQDRVAAESTLETATQRSSLVNLARLVDYEPRPAVSAATILMLGVSASSVPAGAQVAATAPDGTLVPFEIGAGLADSSSYPVSPAWNWPIQPYWWDDANRCLPRNSTEMWLQGQGFGFAVGTALLIQTDLPGESIRQVVHVTEMEEAVDPLFTPGGAPLTRIAWAPAEALERDRDLTQTLVGGNLVPATQGARQQEAVAIDLVPPSAPNTLRAIARQGPNGSDAQPNFVFRYPLSKGLLAWLADADPANPPWPEVGLSQTLPSPQSWAFERSLLDADPLENAFTVEPVAWRAVDWDQVGRPVQWEMDGDDGWTVRFGDGVFGLPPAPDAVFDVAYRTGLGAAGNVAADSITEISPAWSGLITAVRNPFPAAGGADAETAEHIRRMAPQAFRARQFRAVRPQDYKAAAEELPWVQQAGAAFRWTGSWLTAFTTVDPGGSEAVSEPEHLELVELLNRRRLAGYESYAPAPRYVSVDLQITICVAADSLPADVERRVLDRLGSAIRPDGTSGFFFADRFTFGSPLFRSRLEAAIQAVPGVKGVLSIEVRRRGVLTGFTDLPEIFPLAADQILRIDNDPDWPERGTIQVIPEGGR